MSTGRFRVAVPVAALALLTACGGDAICGACMASPYLNVQTGKRPAGTELRFCLDDSEVCSSEELGDLEPGPSTKGTKPAQVESHELTHMDFDTDLVGKDLDGRTVTVTLIPPAGTGAPLSQAVALTYHDDGDGECACSYATNAEPVVFSRWNQGRQ